MKIFLKKYADTMIAFLYAIIVWVWIYPISFRALRVILVFWNYQKGVETHAGIGFAMLGGIFVLECALALFLIFLAVCKTNQMTGEKSFVSHKRHAYTGCSAGAFVAWGVTAIETLVLNRSPHFDVSVTILFAFIRLGGCIAGLLASLLLLRAIYFFAERWQNALLIRNRYSLLMTGTMLLLLIGGFTLMNYENIIRLWC